MNRQKNGFTIVELLISITIIALLIGILLPSIHHIREKAREAAQHAQFTAIDMGLDSFRAVYGDYPPSQGFQVPPLPFAPLHYGGAQKLAEALLGWDLLGFHQNSQWTANGRDTTGTTLIYTPPVATGEREDPYIDIRVARPFRLGNSAYAGAQDGLFNNVAQLIPQNYVLCDVFTTKKIIIDVPSPPVPGGQKVTKSAGTPILYFKAQSDKLTMVPGFNWYDQRYNLLDNAELLDLGPLNPAESGALVHPFATTPDLFYQPKGGLIDPTITAKQWPYRPDSYILISAGRDGLFGTNDDIHNW